MSGGGGSTTATTYTSNLPEYAEPFYTSLMSRAEAASQEPYQPYGNERVASFTPDQEAAFEGARDLYARGAPGVDLGQLWTAYGLESLGGSIEGPDVVSTYGGPQVYDPLEVEGGVFDADARDFYMSPYMDAVTERLKEEAILDAQRQQKYRDAEAVAAGAFGGDRRFVYDALSDEALNRLLADIEARQTQAAFENAQQQFERDRQARLQAAGMGEQSRQYGAGLYEQGSQFGAGLAADLGKFAKQFDIDASNALFGGSRMLGDLGELGQNLEMARIQALQDQGLLEQQQQQRLLNQAYEDFINQRDYERNTLAWLSGILHGVPVSSESNVVQYQSSNPLAGAVGSGIAGLSLYKALQGV